MRDPSPGESRAEIRSWLRRAVRFGSLLDLPDADAMARALLAELTDPATARGSVAHVVAEAEAFRQGVEAQLRAARRRALKEAQPGRIDLDRPAPRRFPTISGPTDKPPPHLRPVKEPNPLWDRWLDG